MINIYTSVRIPHVGGMSTHILAVKKYLTDIGQHVRLFSKPGSTVPRSGGANRYHPAVYLTSALLKVAHCFFAYPAASGRFNFYHDWFSILGVRSRPGARRMLYVHGELANELVALGTIRKDSGWYRVFQNIERRAVRRADIVICVDSRLAEYVRSELGVEAISKANFVSTPSPVRVPVAPGDEVRLVLSRRFVEKNGLEYALTAVDLIHAALAPRISVRCDVFGSGQLFAELSQRFNRPYIFFRGDVTPEDVRHCLRHGHFCMVPSIPVGDYVEATSISALEAAVEGCIVVASNVGGLRELFSGTGGACLVAPKDAAAIAVAVIELVRDPSAFVRTAETGQTVVLENHSDKIYVENFILKL